MWFWIIKWSMYHIHPRDLSIITLCYFSFYLIKFSLQQNKKTFLKIFITIANSSRYLRYQFVIKINILITLKKCCCAIKIIVSLLNVYSLAQDRTLQRRDVVTKFNTSSNKLLAAAAARRLPNYANPPPSTDLMKRGTIELKGVKWFVCSKQMN